MHPFIPVYSYSEELVPAFDPLSMNIRFLHTNDFHGKLDQAVFEQLLPLRKNADLYFDCGDIIRTGNLGIPLSPDLAWSYLAQLDCTASVLGNRETHPLQAAFDRKIEGHKHPILAGNMHHRDGSAAFPESLILDVQGVRVGVVSTMVAMATPRMKTAGAWSYLWDAPIETACRLARELRRTVDLLVALTHIGFSQDQVLAQKCPEIDIIFGGHSHTVLDTPVQVERTWIVQTGSHGRFAGVYEWEDGLLRGELVPLQRG